MSDYKSNDNEEGYVTNLEDEEPIAQLASSMKRHEYKFEVSEEVVFKVGQHFDGYKHFKLVMKDYVIQNRFK